MSRLTYANVMATLGVFLALGGVGYATVLLPAGSVGTKQLKHGAVTGDKVKAGSLLAKSFKAGQLPAGPQGPAGLAGPAGPQGLAGAKGDQGPAGLAPVYTSFVPQGTLTGAGPQQLVLVHLPQQAPGTFSPGPYLVYANAEFQRGDTNAALQDDIKCDLEDSGINIDGPLDESEVALPPSPARATVSLISTVDLSPSAFVFPPVWLTCSRVGNGVGDVTFYDVDIGAVRVSSVS
jgi:hypothetical protein